MELDYSIKDQKGRLAAVQEALEDDPSPSSKNLSYMANYLLFLSDKGQTKREKKEDYPIVTNNREVTVRKRQVSYEKIVSSLENGEDGLYLMINNDKNQILDPKDPISEKDLNQSPRLREALATIESLQKQFEKAEGQRKYSLKKQIIETWQQVYILKASLKSGSARGKIPNQIKFMAHMPLDDKIALDENLVPRSSCPINLIEPESISFLLCYYSQLKQECAEDLFSDMFHLLLDLENLIVDTFKDKYDFLYDLVIYKIDGLTNEEIQRKMDAKYGIVRNEQYYSTLWRKRIPRLLAIEAQKKWLIWHYTNEEYGNWKECGRCHQIKPAHPMFYSKNDNHYYSICKECRKYYR